MSEPTAGPAQLTYFKGRGRAETTRWMLAVNRIAFINVAIETPQQMSALRASGRLPFDQLPLLEIDGLRISQTTALIRHLARSGDLYGETHHDALWCDMIAGVAADLAEPAIVAAFEPSRAIAIDKLRQRLAKFGPRLEQRLAENRGFCAGTRLTFADVLLGEALSAHVEIDGAILAGYPALERLQRQIVQLRGIAAYLTSPQRWPAADDAYVIDVARVLQRALPAHMPDPGRFLVA